VVDLWGGYRDARRRDPWEEDTLATVFSTTKGMAAMAIAVAHSRGLFELDEPVVAYWPEFAQGGKAAITVRQLLSHQAGLSAIDERLDLEVLSDLDRLAEIIARQQPAWEPGSRHGYHGLSLGYYENELIRRVDSEHRSIGRFLWEEVVRPLDIEFYIGLPAKVPASRLATIQAFHPLAMLLHPTTIPLRMVLALLWPPSLVARTLTNPRMRGPGDMDLPEYRAVEFPSGSGVAQARALAKAYGAFATGGLALGLAPRTMDELTAPPTPPTGGSRDLIIGWKTAYGLGFWKPCPVFLPELSPRAFGGAGAGGSLGFADPDTQVGYGYVMNRMGFHMYDDPREKALRDALYRCLGR
jgi:CubicO group peptidase (beta-lactamase class C family)